jgi:YVTN family beta-propeller protein
MSEPLSSNRVNRVAAILRCAGVFALLLLNQSHSFGQQSSSTQERGPQRFTHEGVAVEFTIDPLANDRGADLLEGKEATVRLRITDSSGKPLTNLRPAGWIDLRDASKPPDARACREKVQKLLQGSYSDSADIDLNTYFILALNDEANISVIDPLSGFGSTKLYTLIALPSPGEDWALTKDRKRLYVSMPLANQVAVVDTNTLSVIEKIAAGSTPTRLALQNDERYLWVGNRGSVTVIDTAKSAIAAAIKIGEGPHEFAFTDDDRFAFVTNKKGGTLSVIDVRRLESVRELQLGQLPASIAFSSLGKAVYIANEGDGAITVVGGAEHEILARIKAEPGIRAIRFSPDGRFGFVVNSATSTVSIFDASTNRLVRTVPVDPKPDQINFTRDFAYVRSTASEFISMLRIGELGKQGNEVAVTRFPAGQKSPRLASSTSPAPTLIPSLELGAVLVANPADKTIYYYMEGMAAPMGSFSNYRREPRALMLLDRSLRETSPGVYATTVRLKGRGQYDMAFVLDAPRIVNCFDVVVKENPDLPKTGGVPITVETISKDSFIKVGETYNVRFKVVDTNSKQPKLDMNDMGVLVFLTPGIWQRREWAKPLGDGTYEMSFAPPEAGVYYVYFHAPSLGVRSNQLPFLTLTAVKDMQAPASKTP